MPEVIIPGTAGRLEGRYKHNSNPKSPIALILHPNPKQGGTMNNKITYNLYHTLAEQGYSVLRFNFRGVGRSQGEYDNGEGELNDAAAALDWLQNMNPTNSGILVAGFSFGAWIGMQLLMRRPEIKKYISIAPPANMYDFNFLAPCPNDGMIIQGNNDKIVSKDSVDKLVEKLIEQRGKDGVDYRIIDGAGHFFSNDGDMDSLISSVKDYASVIEPLSKAA